MANRMISYGYGMQDGKLSIIAEEAEVVNRIFAAYIDGKRLDEIAGELTIEGVEFFLGNCQWNKNRIARIIDNEKYIGADGYPQIVDEDDFVYARQLKSEKGAKKIHFDEEIEYLRNNKITCAQCGSPMRRISKWRSREKWLCRCGCSNDIYISDAVIFGGVNAILQKVVENPDNAVPSRDERMANLELKRCQNEVNRIFGSKSPTFTVGKRLIFELVSLRFEALNENSPDIYTEMLVKDCADALAQSSISREFIEKHIKKLSIDKAGCITVLFDNGAELTNAKEV